MSIKHETITCSGTVVYFDRCGKGTMKLSSNMKCKTCGFAAGERVHMRSGNMPGKILRGEIEKWQAGCGHIATWKEIAAEGGEYTAFTTADGRPIMATPTWVEEMGEKNTNIVRVTEKLPEIRKPS